MLEKLSEFLAHHAAAAIAGSTSIVGTLGLATGALPVPQEVPSWLPYAISILGPMLAVVGTKLLAAFAARQRALAAAKRSRAASDAVTAKALLADGDARNDVEARALLESAHKRLDEADALDAQAEALDAIGKLKR